MVHCQCYTEFKVGNSIDEYPLTVSGFTGITVTDPFVSYHNDRKFSTYDNDYHSNKNCAGGGSGGWLYRSCWRINANLPYNHTQFINLDTIWYDLRSIEMKAVHSIASLSDIVITCYTSLLADHLNSGYLASVY